MADADADAKRESIVRRLVKEAQKAPNAEVDARLVRGLGEGALLSEKGSEAVSERSMPGSTPWEPGVKAKSALEGVLQRGVDAAERHGFGTAASVAASVPMAAADMLIPTTVGELQMAAGGPKVPKKGAKIIDLSERRQKLEKLVKALKGETDDAAEAIGRTQSAEEVAKAGVRSLDPNDWAAAWQKRTEDALASGRVSESTLAEYTAAKAEYDRLAAKVFDPENGLGVSSQAGKQLTATKGELARLETEIQKQAGTWRSNPGVGMTDERAGKFWDKWKKDTKKLEGAEEKKARTFADPGKRAFEEAIAKKRADDAAAAAKKPEGKLTPEQQAMKRREENARILEKLRRDKGEE